MNNILENRTENLTILLSDPHTEIGTSKIMKLINDLSKSSTPTLLCELSSRQHWENLRLNEDNLNKSNIYIGQTCLLEDICDTAKLYHEQYGIKYLIIDSLVDIATIERYYLGRSDILSIVLKQLKELAQELKISIIITAPLSPHTSIDDLRTNKNKILSCFCKSETAQDYIDEIVMI